MPPEFELPNFDLNSTRLGQHLLTSRSALEKLVSSADISANSVVADLGAATGAITEEVVRQNPRRVYAIEIDPRFRPFLARLESSKSPEVVVLQGDLLTCMPSDITTVVANPPFGVTEKLIQALRRLPRLTTASLVMGSPFCRSALAASGSKNYNRLSLATQTWFSARLVDRLSQQDFYPRMRGRPCIIRLDVRQKVPDWESVIANAFADKGGSRLKDLVWRLEHKHQVGQGLRHCSFVRKKQQDRLQQLTSRDLSHFMVEVSAATGRGSGFAGCW